MIGILSRDWSAAFWSESYMSAHCVAVPPAPLGPSPPPLRIYPRASVARSEVEVRAFLFAWVIWRIFSARVIIDKQFAGEVQAAACAEGPGSTDPAVDSVSTIKPAAARNRKAGLTAPVQRPGVR